MIYVSSFLLGAKILLFYYIHKKSEFFELKKQLLGITFRA